MAAELQHVKVQTFVLKQYEVNIFQWYIFNISTCYKVAVHSWTAIPFSMDFELKQYEVNIF